MSKDFDSKLLKNVLDEINRLNNTLVDLETYKDEFTEEEIEETKEKTLKELFETQKILEKMKTGELTTNTEIDNAKKKMLEIIGRNYSVKDLLNKYLTTETEGLREKLKALIHLKEMKKVTEQEFNSNVLAILQIISKNTKLNDEEQKLYNRISNNNLSSFQEDKGIDQTKSEKNFEAFSLSPFVKKDVAKLSNLLTSIVCINLGNLKNLIILYFVSEEDIKNSNGIIDNISIKNHPFIYLNAILLKSVIINNVEKS